MINVWILLFLLPGDNQMVFASPINIADQEFQKLREMEEASELLLSLKSSRAHDEQLEHAKSFLADEISDEDLQEELIHECNLDDEENDYYCVFFVCKKAEFMHWCEMGKKGFFCVDEPTEEIFYSFIDENDGIAKTVNVTNHFEKEGGAICKDQGIIYKEEPSGLFAEDDK